MTDLLQWNHCMGCMRKRSLLSEHPSYIACFVPNCVENSGRYKNFWRNSVLFHPLEKFIVAQNYLKILCLCGIQSLWTYSQKSLNSVLSYFDTVKFCLSKFYFNIGPTLGLLMFGANIGKCSQRHNLTFQRTTAVKTSDSLCLCALLKHTRIFGRCKLTRWFKYDRDWFVCKQAALRSSCATLREWSHNLHPPSCSG